MQCNDIAFHLFKIQPVALQNVGSTSHISQSIFWHFWNSCFSKHLLFPDRAHLLLDYRRAERKVNFNPLMTNLLSKSIDWFLYDGEHWS